MNAKEAPLSLKLFTSSLHVLIGVLACSDLLQPQTAIDRNHTPRRLSVCSKRCSALRIDKEAAREDGGKVRRRRQLALKLLNIAMATAVELDPARLRQELAELAEQRGEVRQCIALRRRCISCNLSHLQLASA